LAAILEIRIFCDASISNINQHILKYIQTKFHAFTMKCTMVFMIRCTMSDYPAFRDMLCYKLLLAYVLSIIREKENKISF